jgi:hypothetical protein
LTAAPDFPFLWILAIAQKGTVTIQKASIVGGGWKKKMKVKKISMKEKLPVPVA